MHDDLSLLSQFTLAGNEAAFTELVRRHLGLVYGVCRRHTGSRPLAEELVQNVFASLARKASTLKPGVSVVGWLHRAARLECLNACRAESIRRRKMKNYEDFMSVAELGPPEFRDIVPVLDKALDSLPQADRDVILMRFASGLTLLQIGDALGKSESAAQRHLQRVLEKLAAIFRRHGVTTSASALALFLGADFAKALPVSLTVSAISKGALVSAARTGISLGKIATILSIMKQKTLVITSVSLLIIGTFFAVIVTKPSLLLPSTRVVGSDSNASLLKDISKGKSGEIVENSIRPRPRLAGDLLELENKFGKIQVQRAKSVANNFLRASESIDRIVEFLGSSDSKKGKLTDYCVSADFGSDPLSSRIPNLKLTDNQKSEVKKLQVVRLEKFLNERKMARDCVTKNQVDFIELILSSDSTHRGEMPPADFQATLDRTKEFRINIAKAYEYDPRISKYENDLCVSLETILDKNQKTIFEEYLVEERKNPSKLQDRGMLKFALDLAKDNSQSFEDIETSVVRFSAVSDGITKLVNSEGGK